LYHKNIILSRKSLPELAGSSVPGSLARWQRLKKEGIFSQNSFAGVQGSFAEK